MGIEDLNFLSNWDENVFYDDFKLWFASLPREIREIDMGKFIVRGAYAQMDLMRSYTRFLRMKMFGLDIRFRGGEILGSRES